MAGQRWRVTLLLECLPCALHLEPEGAGHVIIPRADDDSDTLKKACEVSCGRDGQ